MGWLSRAFPSVARIFGGGKEERNKSNAPSSRQGNRVLTKEHLEEVVLDPTGFKQFTLDTPF